MTIYKFARALASGVLDPFSSLYLSPELLVREKGAALGTPLVKSSIAFTANCFETTIILIHLRKNKLF